MIPNLTSLKAFVSTTSLCLIVSWVLADTPGDAERRERDGARAEQRDGNWREARRELERARLDRTYRQQFVEQEQAAIEKATQEHMEQVRQLRVRQVELQAKLERAGLDSDTDLVQTLQRQMVEIQHDIRTAELELERIMFERQRQAERRDMITMTDRLEYVAGWRDVAFDPPQAVMMATQAIVELHMARDDAPGAVAMLEETLDRVKATGVRTAIRFALKDLYTEMEEFGKAAEHMLQVILENALYLDGGAGSE